MYTRIQRYGLRGRSGGVVQILLSRWRQQHIDRITEPTELKGKKKKIRNRTRTKGRGKNNTVGEEGCGESAAAAAVRKRTVQNKINRGIQRRVRAAATGALIAANARGHSRAWPRGRGVRVGVCVLAYFTYACEAQ